MRVARSMQRGPFVHGGIAVMTVILALSASGAGCSSDAAAPQTSATNGGASDAGSKAPDGAGAADASSQDGGAAGADVTTDVAAVQPPPDPGYDVAFSPESATVDGAAISLSVEPIGPSSVRVKASAVKLDDVFGIAFRLRYDPAVLTFAGGKTNPVLDDAVAKGIAALAEAEPGRLVYGQARFFKAGSNGYNPEVTGVAVDDQVLVALDFDVAAEGETALTFELAGRDVRNSQFEAIAVTWVAGSVKITRAKAE